MIEDKFPLVKIVAPLVDFDTSFFDLAGDARNSTCQAGAGTLPLLLPVSLEPGQSTRAWLRQHTADNARGLTVGALLSESHRLAPAGATESLLLSPLLIGAGLSSLAAVPR